MLHSFTGVSVTVGVCTLLLLTTLARAAEDSRHTRLPVSSLPCKMKVMPYSAGYFADWVTNLDANLAHLKLEFVNTSGFRPQFNHTPEVVLPGNIIWTYTSSKASFRYMKWPIDFNILSMGLLSGYTLKKEVTLYLNVTPTDCRMVLGTARTSHMISAAILNFTNKYFEHDKKFSSWCYYSEIEGFRKSTTYQVGRYFVFPGMGVGYKCCEQRKHLASGTFYYRCNKYVTTFSTNCVMVPYILGVILFAYFPILLMRFADIMESCDQPTPARHAEGYETIGTSLSDAEEEYNGTMNTEMQWTFLSSTCPVSFSKYVFTFCTLFDNFPVITSRLRRALFVFLSPVVIYIKLIVYNQYFSEFIHAFLDHGFPVGFLSMLGGVRISSQNFLPYFGGPFMTLGLYFSVGILLLVIPQKLSSHLVKGLPSFESKHGLSTLLRLDIQTIEKLSMLECSLLKGYAKVYTVIHAKLYMMINPKTWHWFLCRQKQRWTVGVSDRYFRFQCFNRFPLVIIKYVGLFLYICVCIVELILACCVHGFPIVNFMLLSVKAYSTGVSDAVKTHQLPYRILLGIMFALSLSCFIFAFSLIFIDSFTFVGKVCVFVYLSILVYPSYSFAYIFFAGTTIYYITKIARSFRETYVRLLRDIIEISIEMKQRLRKERETYVQNETLYIHMNDLSGVKHIDLNGFKMHLEDSQINDVSIQETDPYVRYLNNCPGIPTQLFDQVIHHRKPIYISMFLSLCQIVLICVLALVSLYLVSEHNTSVEIGGLMHVISVLVVGTIPRVVQAVVSKGKRGVIEEEHQRCIMETVKDFWRKQRADNQ